jgi:hypothetical protein
MFYLGALKWTRVAELHLQLAQALYCHMMP